MAKRAAPKPIEQAPPPAGHNSQTAPGEAQRSGVDDEALIAENFKLEDQIKAGQAKFNEWALPLQTRVKEIEAEISRRLLERKADSTKTDAGTAYFSDIMSTEVENAEALFDFVADNWNEIGADVKLNVPIGTVRQYMDGHEGNLPPGMSNSFFKRLNLRRS